MPSSSAPDGRQAHVRLLATMAADTPEHLLLRIADNGIGMASEVVDRLFGLHASRCGHHPALWRQRSRVGHLQATGDADGGDDRCAEQAWPWQRIRGELPIVRAPMAQPRRYPAIDGQHCIVVGEPRDVDDLCSYLEHAKAQLHRSPTHWRRRNARKAFMRRS